jgi:hypothetical protein
MATSHFNVKGRTSLDGSGWAAGLRKMEVGTKGAAARMAGSMSSMIGGVFAVGFLASATRRIVQHADQIDKTAKRINASTDTVQKFDFAAVQSGATLTDVEKSFINTSKAIEAAKQGLTTQIRAFDAFGITMQMLKNSTPEEIFIKIAEAIQKAGGALDRAKSLQDIMGRGGSRLIPAFTGGFADLMGDAPNLIDAETVKRLAEFNDQLDRLKRDALPAATEAVGIFADLMQMMLDGTGGTKASLGDRASNLVKNAGTVLSGVHPLGMANLLMGDRVTRPEFWNGADVTEDDWADVNQEYGAPIPMVRDPFTEKNRQDFTSSILGFDTNPMIGPQLPQTATTAAGGGVGGFMRPNLALNSLQRIGAAVSQSADPVAIQKDNNKLLNKIANNTKTMAVNSE